MLTEEEKVRSRHHLGYLNVQAAQTFVLGTPAGVQTQFMIEGAFNRILPQAEGKIRDLLCKLDRVEAFIEGNTENLAVLEIGDIKINAQDFKALLQRYTWWRSALANLFGIEPNPYDQRFNNWGGGGTMVNVPVSG